VRCQGLDITNVMIGLLADNAREYRRRPTDMIVLPESFDVGLAVLQRESERAISPPQHLAYSPLR
jgi:hypothetical protein